jgi:NAD(P)-dependent dehydrogenase (short-subunit alcohol dehydrogenase family)
MNAEKNAEAVAALGAKGVTARSAVVNVANEGEWVAAVAAFAAEFSGRIDALVQCAGITGKTGIKCAEVDAGNFDAVMSVNARGIFLGCKTVLPFMLARNYGRIVNIASVAGKEGNAGMLAYSASKGAVIALTKVRAWGGRACGGRACGGASEASPQSERSERIGVSEGTLMGDGT